MASSTYGPPLSSQQSTSSDLSEPPDFTKEEAAEFTATMAPSRAESKVRDEIVAEVAEVAEVAPAPAPAPRSSRRRVPSKRTQVSFTQPPTSSATAAPKRLKMANSKKWAPEYVTQSKQSPLVNKDLRVSFPCQSPEYARLLTVTGPSAAPSSVGRTRRRGQEGAHRPLSRHETYLERQHARRASKRHVTAERRQLPSRY